MTIHSKKIISFLYNRVRGVRRKHLKQKLVAWNTLLGSKNVKVFGRLGNFHRDRNAVI